MSQWCPGVTPFRQSSYISIDSMYWTRLGTWSQCSCCMSRFGQSPDGLHHELVWLRHPVPCEVFAGQFSSSQHRDCHSSRSSQVRMSPRGQAVRTDWGEWRNCLISTHMIVTISPAWFDLCIHIKLLVVSVYRQDYWLMSMLTTLCHLQRRVPRGPSDNRESMLTLCQSRWLPTWQHSAWVDKTGSQILDPHNTVWS